MNVALREIMTLEQFLAWEEHQELRFEFDGFQPVAMTGGTDAHARIQINLTTALHNALHGKTCRPYGSHLKVLVDGRIRYQDAFVGCTPTRPLDQLNTEPVVIFEILSPSTTNTDMIQKNAEYRATASVQRHVILQQSYPGALVFIRKGAD